ncbi:MAG: type II secretion system protein GspG [Nitrospirota bacterium]
MIHCFFILVVSLGLLTSCSTTEKKREKINADIGVIVSALEKYKHDVGDYPTTSENLSALVKAPPSSLDTGKWKGPYLQHVPRSPWGKEYHYEIGNVWLVASEGPPPFGPGWTWDKTHFLWVKKEQGYIIRVWSPDGLLASVPKTQFGYWPSFVYTMLPAGQE